MSKVIEPQLRTVIVLSARGKIAAADLVATQHQHSYLFCGSVSKQYGGKGYWRLLVSARQMISKAQGAQAWVTTTKNPRIMNKGNQSYQILIFTEAV